MIGSGRRGDRMVVLIGAFRLIKAGLLIALGTGGLIGYVHRDAGSLLYASNWTGVLAGHRAMRGLVTRLSAGDGHFIRDLAIAALCYGAVFAVEGVGLIMRKRWAEWLTLIVTGSFIPFEIYELAHRPGAGKALALIINVAIVVYLAWRRVGERAQARRWDRRRTEGISRLRVTAWR